MTFCKRLLRAADLWLEKDGLVYSAALAYYAALSVLPILLLVDALHHLVLTQFHVDWRLHEPLLDVVQEVGSEQLRSAFEDAVASTHKHHAVGGPLGAAWLLLTSLLVFVQVDRGLRRLWFENPATNYNVISKSIGLVKDRTRAILLSSFFGVILTCIYSMSVVVDSLARVVELPSDWAQAAAWQLHIVVHVAVITVNFGVIFKFFTPMPVATKDALHASFLLAVGWEVGRQFLAVFVVRDYRSLYGIFGAFMLILLWIYYAGVLVYYAAAYLRCLVEERAPPGERA